MLGVWAVLTLSQLGFVLQFGHDQPWADEWEFVPTLTGQAPYDAFYFQPHNEHRLPQPRAIYLGLWSLTQDFRSGMVLQVVLLALMALRGMQLAERLRGRADWADAFFPLSLLHVGHCENLLMGYQLCFVLAAGFAFGVLELAVRWTPENGPRTALLAALATLSLCLCGGFGIVLAGPTGLRTLLLIARNGTRSLFSTAAVIGILGSALVYLVFVFSTYQRPPDHPPFRLENWSASLQVAGQFLAVSFGIGTGIIWFAVLPLIGVAAGIAARELRQFPRSYAVGIAAVAVGVILLSLAVGIGRGGFNSQMGLWPRYSVLGWPLLAAIVLASANHRWLPRALASAALLAFVPNTIHGVEYGARHDAWLSAIETDVRNGRPPEEMIEDWLKGTGHEARALRGIPMLRAANIGPFSRGRVSR